MLAQAHVLAGARRYQLLREVIGAGPRGVGVAQLAERFGVTRTAVRLHLARLVDGGLVVARSGPRAGPGRPGLRYCPTAAAGRWSDGGPFEQVARALEPGNGPLGTAPGVNSDLRSRSVRREEVDEQ